MTFRPPVIETDLDARDRSEWDWNFDLQKVHEEWYYKKTLLRDSVRLATHMWV